MGAGARVAADGEHRDAGCRSPVRDGVLERVWLSAAGSESFRPETRQRIRYRTMVEWVRELRNTSIARPAVYQR
jgi:hypothetical protein